MSDKKPVKSILITQDAKSEGMAAYSALGEKWGVKVDFRRFIRVDPVSLNDFRKIGVHPLDFGAVIFTSKIAVDHFFRLVNEMRIEMPPETKFFCVGEGVSKYLQKYVVIRKRKLFVGEKTAMDLIPLLEKARKDKIMIPCSNVRLSELPKVMLEKGLDFVETEIYQTVPDDLSDLEDVFYDMICFFAPSGFHALYNNFPEFKQNETRIAVLGANTALEGRNRGLILNVEAPKPGVPSLTSGIEEYLKEIHIPILDFGSSEKKYDIHRLIQGSFQNANGSFQKTGKFSTLC
jgi:uroporphyrinogen-III synthase